MTETIAVLGPGRIGRQIALAFALGGCRVRLIDIKEGRSVADAERTLADARREIARDVALMVEEQVIEAPAATAALARIEERVGLGALDDCGFVQEALPESVTLQGRYQPKQHRAILSGKLVEGGAPAAQVRVFLDSSHADNDLESYETLTKRDGSFSIFAPGVQRPTLLPNNSSRCSALMALCVRMP